MRFFMFAAVFAAFCFCAASVAACDNSTQQPAASGQPVVVPSWYWEGPIMRWHRNVYQRRAMRRMYWNAGRPAPFYVPAVRVRVDAVGVAVF